MKKLKKIWHFFLSFLTKKIIQMYTEYQVKSITNIIKNKICNNTYSNDRIIVSENSQLNRLIFEIDTDICKFDLIIELLNNSIDFKIGTNIEAKLNSDLTSFTTEMSNFNKRCQENKKLIEGLFIILTK